MSDTLPTRLFKLDTQAVHQAVESFDITKYSLGKIIEGQALSDLKFVNYCTVSHVWGTKPPVFKVAGIDWDVPISSKEKLIFILKACERRGYEYVWIDLLCINQTRHAPEQEEEMQKMRQYYQKAHATIVFGSNWGAFASQWAKVAARIIEWKWDLEKVINPSWDGFGEIDTLIDDDWFKRVWTLQETLIPLTTSLSDTIVLTPPAPYTPARLLTSDGSPMDIRSLCDLIDWTYISLGKLEYTTHPGKYAWVHPGHGIANEHGWWMLSILTEDLERGDALLHPIQAMGLTRYRETSYPIDRLKGVYALIDAKWYSTEKSGETPDVAYRKLAEKYIAEREGALLLAMAVRKEDDRTWAAAVFPDSEVASFVPKSGEYTLNSAKVDGDTLHFKATVLNAIKVHNPQEYKDGSGELKRLITDLRGLESTHDISFIVTLINKAITKSRINQPSNSIGDIESIINTTSNANAVSSGLRQIFSGWKRWIITASVQGRQKPSAFLAWLPFHEDQGGKGIYSLLWVHSNKNEWAVVVEGDTKTGCRKSGIAFADLAASVDVDVAMK